jgi:flagellar motility protein MotE (MotC chaperone)
VIVTRHRKARPHPARVLIPLAFLALLVAAFTWPPSQRAIANGPLHPLWSASASTGGVLARPLTFAAQQQTITERNRQIRDLDGQLERQRQAKADAESRAQQLQQQLAALANQPHETPAPAPRRPAAPALGGGAAPASAVAGNASAGSADERRLAATWAAMEPEKAAAIVQRLPDDAVTRVLAQMDADSAGAIMNALPSSAAARISRAVAQVPPAAGR